VTKQGILTYLLLASLTISTMVLILPPVKAEPTTWTVADETPAVFSTIQDTVDAANNGDSASIEYVVLSIVVNGYGSTSPAVGSYTYENGSEIAVTANDSYASGWLFEYWVLDGLTKIERKKHNPLYLTMDQNHELMAVFLKAPNPYPPPEPTPSPSPSPEPTATPTPTPSPAIPELTWVVLPPFMIATLLTAIFCFKKRKH